MISCQTNYFSGLTFDMSLQKQLNRHNSTSNCNTWKYIILLTRISLVWIQNWNISTTWLFTSQWINNKRQLDYDKEMYFQSLEGNLYLFNLLKDSPWGHELCIYYVIQVLLVLTIKHCISIDFIALTSAL